MSIKESMSHRKRLLIIDKDYEQYNFFKSRIEDYGYDIILLDSLQKCYDISKYSDVNAIFLSLIKFGDNGAVILKYVLENNLDVPIIIQTNYNCLKLHLHSFQNKINSFFFNPISADQIVDSVRSVLDSNSSPYINEIEKDDLSLDSLIAVSSAMIRVINLARVAAECTIPVMIEGEFGVGKKTLARSIHASGSRSDYPFIIVNCKIIDKDEIDLFLFGDLEDKMQNPGKFIEANEGTIFFDEAQLLPIKIQEKIAILSIQVELTALIDYDWPDNVKELENVVFQSAIASEGLQITENLLLHSRLLDDQKEDKVKLENLNDLKSDRQIISNSRDFTPISQYSIIVLNKNGEMRSISDIEKEIIQLAMVLYQNHMSEVARRLGIGRSTLYRKLREYGI